MSITRIAIAAALGLALVSPAHAQFGGVLRRAKDKLDRTKDKAKPVSERAERGADTFRPWSAEEEQRIGEATAAKLVAMFGLVEDPQVVRYVNLVGLTVAKFVPRQLPYRFGILDSEIVGAFALPGGFVFLTRAALEGMKNEAELAGALAHEMVHASERHLEKEVRSKNLSVWAAQEGQRAAVADEELRKKADVFVRDMFNMRLSRDKEDAADEQGALLAAQAGYRAGGLLDFLRTLAALNNSAENQRFFGQLLSTHPAFEERVARLEPVVARSGDRGQALEERFQAALRR